LFIVSCSEISIKKEAKGANRTTERTSELESVAQKPTKPNKESTNTERNMCSALAQADCLKSTQCILDQTIGLSYFCRAAKNDCEIGFVQADYFGKQSCTTKNNCQFKPASCFCPSGVVCKCGGGRPSACSEMKLLDS